MVTKEIIEFYESSKRICYYLTDTVIRQENVEELLLLLLDLYGKGLLLLDVEPDSVDNHTKSETISDIRIEIPTCYWEVFDPWTEEEMVCGDLYDDLTDIRHDLMKGIIEYEAGYINNAVFNWKLFHRSHYGNHIVATMKALQHLREDN